MSDEVMPSSPAEMHLQMLDIIYGREKSDPQKAAEYLQMYDVALAELTTLQPPSNGDSGDAIRAYEKRKAELEAASNYAFGTNRSENKPGAQAFANRQTMEANNRLRFAIQDRAKKLGLADNHDIIWAGQEHAFWDRIRGDLEKGLI